MQRARNGHGKHRSLEWLVGYVGIYRPHEILRRVIASIIDDLKSGHILNILETSLPFGLRVIEYLARRHPPQTSDVLRLHFLRFLRYTQADKTSDDVQLLAFIVLLALECPAATQLIFPLALGSFSTPSVIEGLIAREAQTPSHVPGEVGSTFLNSMPSMPRHALILLLAVLDVITEALIAHLSHMQSHSFQVLLLLEALRRQRIKGGHRSLLSCLLDDEVRYCLCGFASLSYRSKVLLCSTGSRVQYGR